MTYINIYDLCRSYINILFQKKHKRIYTKTSFREPQPVKIDFGEPEQQNSIFYGKKKNTQKKLKAFKCKIMQLIYQLYLYCNFLPCFILIFLRVLTFFLHIKLELRDDYGSERERIFSLWCTKLCPILSTLPKVL